MEFKFYGYWYGICVDIPLSEELEFPEPDVLTNSNIEEISENADTFAHPTISVQSEGFSRFSAVFEEGTIA
jgi:hypothetical protein